MLDKKREMDAQLLFHINAPPNPNYVRFSAGHACISYYMRLFLFFFRYCVKVHT